MKLINFNRSDLKYLNGFMPVNKPKGVCCNKLMYALRDELNFALSQHKIGHTQIDIFYAKGLEKFASGLVTFIYGSGNYRKRNFVHADYQYRATVEFGVERKSHLIVDSPILCRANINHLHRLRIERALESFKGTTTQDRWRHPDEHDDGLELSEKLASFEGIYDLIKSGEFSKSSEISQKYPCMLPLRQVYCKDIKLIEYSEPFATFDINSSGAFGVGQFVTDLGEKLETKANLTELVRLKEGPIGLDDLRVIQLHETNVEDYINRMRILNNLYHSYISKYDDLFQEHTYRPMIR